ncbi:MAG: protein kinase [Myxococcales bacterium]|nr:protein kinase [Myxococcales bacterium]
MRPGSQLGRYSLLEKLSDGFPGDRWAARGGDDGGLYAIRSIDTARLTDPEAVQHFAGVAFWAMELRYGALISPRDVIASDGQLAVVEPYIEGETLRTLLRRAHRERTAIPPAAVLRIVGDLLVGLSALEQAVQNEPEMAPFAYGGLHPDGVLIARDGYTRLLDPGVAALASADPAWARDPVRASYQAPERFAGGGIDGRSDIFVLGILMWEMLCLQHLFSGLQSHKVAEALWAREIPPLSTHARDPVSLPRGLADVIHRCLERHPEARFADRGELREALARLPLQPSSPAAITELCDRIGGRQSAERRRRLR